MRYINDYELNLNGTYAIESKSIENKVNYNDFITEWTIFFVNSNMQFDMIVNTIKTFKCCSVMRYFA